MPHIFQEQVFPIPHSVSPTDGDFLFKETAWPISPVTLSSFVVRTSRTALNPIRRLSSPSFSKTRTKDCLNMDDVKLSVRIMCPPVELQRLFISRSPTWSRHPANISIMWPLWAVLLARLS